MRSRRRTLLAAAATCAALTVPVSAASAEDFCVGGPAGCTGTPVAAAALKQALAGAQANGTDDRFILAPGVFASDTFAYHSGERVQLIGAGAGRTILRGNGDGAVLKLAGTEGSSVSGLTLEPAGAATGGLTLKGARAHRVAVKAAGAASLDVGVSLHGDARFDDGTVDLGTLARQAVIVYGDGAVTDSTITAPRGVAVATAGSRSAVRRSTLDARFGAIAIGGHLTIADTLVDLRGHGAPGGDPAIGVFATPNPGGTATADVDRVTIAGSTAGTAESVGVSASADSAGNRATLRMRDSVISGIGVPVARHAVDGATAGVTTSRSAYGSGVTPSSTGPGELVERSRLNVSPGFVGNGDFHLAADSPLIDAGTPGALPAGATDRDGRPRVSDGDGDCVRVGDVGAFEYQGTPVRAVAAGRRARFTAAGSCAPGPRISRLRVTPGRVRIGAVVRPVATIGFRLTRRATVALRFQRLGRHGRPRTATLRVGARKGRNRIRSAVLEPGRYRLTARATDEAGLRSGRARTRFTAR